MVIQLKYTIVNVPDKRESAAFLAEILDRPAPVAFGPFLVVKLDKACPSTSPMTTDPRLLSTTRSW